MSTTPHRQALKSPHIVGLFCPYSRSLLTLVWSTQCPHLFAREAPDDASVLREEEPTWMWERRDSISGSGECRHYWGNVADNPPWVWREQGLLWWRAQLLSFLMSPHALLRRRIRHVKNLIGYSHPIIGLHIRHGDACTHASLSNYRPHCKSVDDYFRQVKKNKKNLNTKMSTKTIVYA